MPGFVTHYLFGLDAYRQIHSESIRQNLHKNHSAFALGLQSTGTAGELMYLSSLVNTILQAMDLEQIYLTCNGRVIETGHNYYDMPLEWFSWKLPVSELEEKTE